MASILRVNTLTDASSNNSTAMSTINQGTAKVWAHINQQSFAVDDSFNIASAVDESTGNITHNLTSAMVNSDYVPLGHYTPANNNNGSDNFSITLATTSYEQRHFENGIQYDAGYRGSTVHGDLA
jgi:hypothetical protein